MGRKQSALKRLLQGAKGTRREQTGVLFVDCWHFSRSPQRARIAPATISPGQKKNYIFFPCCCGLSSAAARDSLCSCYYVTLPNFVVCALASLSKHPFCAARDIQFVSPSLTFNCQIRLATTTTEREKFFSNPAAASRLVFLVTSLVTQ